MTMINENIKNYERELKALDVEVDFEHSRKIAKLEGRYEREDDTVLSNDIFYDDSTVINYYTHKYAI